MTNWFLCRVYNRFTSHHSPFLRIFCFVNCYFFRAGGDIFEIAHWTKTTFISTIWGKFIKFIKNNWSWILKQNSSSLLQTFWANPSNGLTGYLQMTIISLIGWIRNNRNTKSLYNLFSFVACYLRLNLGHRMISTLKLKWNCLRFVSGSFAIAVATVSLILCVCLSMNCLCWLVRIAMCVSVSVVRRHAVFIYLHRLQNVGWTSVVVSDDATKYLW